MDAGLPPADLLAPVVSAGAVVSPLLTVLGDAVHPLVAVLAGAVDQLAGLLPSGIAWRLVLIPPITGVIGYVTNWVAIRLLFYPVEFWGVDVPGLQQLTQLLPAKVRQIPGVAEGKIGWQGIVPSRAAKMGSLAVDNSVKRLASTQQFYEQFDPEAVADYVIQTRREEVHDLVEEIIRREHPQLWADAPPQVREIVHDRVDEHLPKVADRLANEVGDHAEDLIDVKLMVVDYTTENPETLNRIFTTVGGKELRFLVNSGFILGTLLGCLSVPLFVVIDQWWVLPVSGVLVGYLTNYIAIKAIFKPVEPRKVGPVELQGLFIKRQEEASEVYAEIVAEEIVTVSNVVDNLLFGSQSDRTRKLIRDVLRPAVDDAVGAVRPLLRVTTGDQEYDAIRERLADEAVEFAYEPLQDPEFNRERSEPIKQLITDRMRELPPRDFERTLRPAFEEDEWLLIGIGAVLGFVAGWLQLLAVTAL